MAAVSDSLATMTRRRTFSDTRSDVNVFLDFSEPQTPPPAWSPIKRVVFWPRPQLCAPRFRVAVKMAAALVITLLAYSTWFLWPVNLAEYRENPSHRSRTIAVNSKDWLWKDFSQHNGLVKGFKDFEACTTDEICKDKPEKVRYDGHQYRKHRNHALVHCTGPRGLRLNESVDDAVWAYRGKANGAVNPTLGSYKASGLDGSVSFERVGRYQAYGIEQFDSAVAALPNQPSKVDWESVNWGELQVACFQENRHRFASVTTRVDNVIQYSDVHTTGRKVNASVTTTDEAGHDKRTAILIRIWTGVQWSSDAVINIRALIAEASLASGGKYQVFILLHVKDEAVALFTDENEPRQTIHRHVPPEFHSITEVWNDAQMRALYSNIAEHAFVGRSPWMILQWFAHNHPEFDFFYQWEFDVRYTGHYLDFFEAVSAFGQRQPRKGIWERAGRLYIPAVHGDFDTHFRARTRQEDPHSVWGPVPVEGVKPRGPRPIDLEENDNFLWGVGEDADWIGFLPSFNVTGTTWWFRDYLWGYAQGKSTPRRSTVVANGRVSRRLLGIMNYENSANGHHMDAEMFPQSVCLHHGLKSTSFPHPVFADRHWPAEALQKVFNGGPHGQAGGFSDSTFSKWNEDAWANFTWYYSSTLAKPLFQAFLGISAMDRGGAEWEAANGRAVVRPMLLHPVKGAKSWHWTVNGWHQTKSGA